MADMDTGGRLRNGAVSCFPVLPISLSALITGVSIWPDFMGLEWNDTLSVRVFLLARVAQSLHSLVLLKDPPAIQYLPSTTIHTIA